jgi:hypothetical protein
MPGNAQIAIIKDTSKCIKKTVADKIPKRNKFIGNKDL